MGLFDLFRRRTQFPEISELDRTRAVWEAYLAAMVAKADGRTGPLCGETITVDEVTLNGEGYRAQVSLETDRRIREVKLANEAAKYPEFAGPYNVGEWMRRAVKAGRVGPAWFFDCHGALWRAGIAAFERPGIRRAAMRGDLEDEVQGFMGQRAMIQTAIWFAERALNVAVVPSAGAASAREADGNEELLPLPVECNGMSLKPLGTIGQGHRQDAQRVWFRSFKGRNPITGAKLEYWVAAL